MIQRKEYLDNLIALKDKQVIKVITGVRRCGKASVLDEKTLERELAPLKEIKDNYPKTLLTLDDIGNGANYEGIRQVNLIDWLLS